MSDSDSWFDDETETDESIPEEIHENSDSDTDDVEEPNRRSDYPFEGIRFFISKSGTVIHISDKGRCCCNSYRAIWEFLEDTPYKDPIHWQTGRFHPVYEAIPENKIRELPRWVQRDATERGQVAIREHSGHVQTVFGGRLCACCRITLEDRLSTRKTTVMPREDFKVVPTFKCHSVTKVWTTERFVYECIHGSYRRVRKMIKHVDHCKKTGKVPNTFLCTFHHNKWQEVLSQFDSNVATMIVSFNF